MPTKLSGRRRAACVLVISGVVLALPAVLRGPARPDESGGSGTQSANPGAGGTSARPGDVGGESGGGRSGRSYCADESGPGGSGESPRTKPSTLASGPATSAKTGTSGGSSVARQGPDGSTDGRGSPVGTGPEGRGTGAGGVGGKPAVAEGGGARVLASEIPADAAVAERAGPLAARVLRVSDDRRFVLAELTTAGSGDVVRAGDAGVIRRAVRPVGTTASPVAATGSADAAEGRVVLRDGPRVGVEFPAPLPAGGVSGAVVVVVPLLADGSADVGRVRAAGMPVVTEVLADGGVRTSERSRSGRPAWLWRAGAVVGRLTAADEAGLRRFVPPAVAETRPPRPGDSTTPPVPAPSPRVGDRVAAAAQPSAPAGVAIGRVVAVQAGGPELRLTVDLGTADGVRPDDRFEICRPGAGFVATAHPESAEALSLTAVVYSPQAREPVRTGDVVVRMPAGSALRIFRVERDYALLAGGEAAGLLEGTRLIVRPAPDLVGATTGNPMSGKVATPGGASAPGGTGTPGATKKPGPGTPKAPAKAPPPAVVDAGSASGVTLRLMAVKMDYAGATVLPHASGIGRRLQRWDLAVPPMTAADGADANAADATTSLLPDLVEGEWAVGRGVCGGRGVELTAVRPTGAAPAGTLPPRVTPVPTLPTVGTVLEGPAPGTGLTRLVVVAVGEPEGRPLAWRIEGAGPLPGQELRHPLPPWRR